jgi:hypothetical protein
MFGISVGVSVGIPTGCGVEGSPTGLSISGGTPIGGFGSSSWGGGGVSGGASAGL